MMIKKALIISAAVIFTQSHMSPVYAKVQKCQDAQGKWHYGNNLGDVCSNESEIQSVRETIKTASSGQGSSNDALKQLELKLLEQTDYFSKDVEQVLAPYNSVQDIETRFDQLKSTTTSQLNEKETVLDALQKKQALLITEKETDSANVDVVIDDNKLRIQNTEDEIEELNAELALLEKRREKVVTLFNQFSDKFGNEQVRQQG